MVQAPGPNWINAQLITVLRTAGNTRFFAISVSSVHIILLMSTPKKYFCLHISLVHFRATIVLKSVVEIEHSPL